MRRSMLFSRHPAPVSVLAAVIASGAVLVPPAHALTVLNPDWLRPPDSFQQANFRGATYGDFAMVGNSVLRCPNATDPTNGGGTSAQCTAVAAGSSNAENDSFYLRRNGSDGGQVFDSSAAQLTVPTGATVEYAQLNWGGDTGRTDLDVVLPLGPTPTPIVSVPLAPVSCTGLTLPDLLPGLLAPAQQPPMPPAAPSPDKQNVQLSVRPVGSAGAGPAVPVEPTNYGTAGALTEMYSAYADVTGTIAAAVSSAGATEGMPTTLAVTVGNVWAVNGFGCSAGWSLTVVFGYPSPPADPTNPYQHLREVDVYTNRLVQHDQMTTDLSVPAPNANANNAGVEVGLSAFGGDPNHSGQLTVGGQPQADPCGAADFFSSCAQGAVDPSDPGVVDRDNFSVDAKAIVPARASESSGSAVDIGLSGASRRYLLQSIVVSENIDPAIGVTMAGPAQPVHAGDPATVNLMVRNTGDVPIFNVALAVGPAGTDPKCQPTLAGSLAPGDTQTVTCTLTAGGSTFAATATATGNYRLNDPHTTVSGSATATVTVIGPVIAVAVAADPPVVRKTDPGQPVTLTFTVSNNSPPAEGPLDATVTTNPAIPGCQPAPVSQVQPGFAATTTCAITPTADTTLAADATATSATFPNDKATATSGKLGIGVINPMLNIAVVADPTTIGPSGAVNFTVAVHNTGDVALVMTVTDDVASACDFSITGTGLAPGTAQSQKCTMAAPTALGPFADTARFAATPVGTTATGIPITGPAATDQLAGHATGTANVNASGNTGNTNGSGSGGGSSAGGTGGSGSGLGSGSGGTTQGSAGGSASPPPQLAYTGVAIGVPLAVGLALVLGGAALTVRRRRGGRARAGRGLTIRYPLRVGEHE